MRSREILGISVVFALFFMITPVFAEHYETKHGTSYDQVGNPITINTSVKNPTNQTVNASIEFVFENIEGNNYWDTKQRSGEATVNKSFGTHQDYFIGDVGRFFISIIKKIDGNVVETSKTDFIIFEEYSNAALSGCAADHELVVKPDYSQAVCIFDESVIQLVQRGWIAKTIFSDEWLLEYYKTLPVVAFHAKYNDVQVSVRDDHVSYFAGSDEDFKIRMNLYFDENSRIYDMELHCYHQNEHQYEIPSEDIVSKLEKYDCRKPDS